MRRPLLWALVIVGLASGAAWAELKIGYVNSEEIFIKFKGTQDAQEKFDKVAAGIQQQATNMKKEIEGLKEQLERQSLLLSKERKKELEDKIKAKAAEFESYVAKHYGREGDLVKKNEEMTKPIIEKIQKIIDKIADEEHYDLVLDSRMGGIIFASKKIDLTDRVLKLLNQQ